MRLVEAKKEAERAARIGLCVRHVPALTSCWQQRSAARLTCHLDQIPADNFPPCSQPGGRLTSRDMAALTSGIFVGTLEIVDETPHPKVSPKNNLLKFVSFVQTRNS